MPPLHPSACLTVLAIVYTHPHGSGRHDAHELGDSRRPPALTPQLSRSGSSGNQEHPMRSWRAFIHPGRSTSRNSRPPRPLLAPTYPPLAVPILCYLGLSGDRVCRMSSLLSMPGLEDLTLAKLTDPFRVHGPRCDTGRRQRGARRPSHPLIAHGGHKSRERVRKCAHLVGDLSLSRLPSTLCGRPPAVFTYELACDLLPDTY